MMRQLSLALFVAVFVTTGCATMGHRQEIVKITVMKNDTLNSIAKKYDTDWKSIVALNQRQLGNGLREGQELLVEPGPKASPDAEMAANEQVPDDQGDDEDMGFLPRRNKGLLYGAPRSGDQAGFIFPVEGGISSHFGKRGRRQHKGIDIIANVGTPIVASGDGEVIFSGRQRGYGLTVVVDHGQFMTLYAHASKLIARTGDRLRQGDFIAKVGRSGNARGAHLHFELRDANNRPIDPEPYLRHKTVAQAGRSQAGLLASMRKSSPRMDASPKSAPRKQKHAANATGKRGRHPSGRRGLLYAKD